MADTDLIPPVVVNGGAGSVQAPGVRAPDYRQLQNPAEVDVRGVDRAATSLETEGQMRARELSNVFKEVSDTGISVLHGMADQAGRQAGAAAGAAGDGAPKTGLQAATTYGQGYNAAVHSTYITSSQLSLEQNLTGIESDTLGNPVAFQQRAAGVVQAALKQMDPMYQPEMTVWAQARIQAGLNRQKAQAQTDAQNQALATYQSATPDLITGALHTAAALPGPQGDAVIAKLVNDDQDRLNALVASRTITPEQALALHNKMVADTHSQMTGQKVDLSLQPILATMRNNVEAADRLIVTPDPNLSAEENAVRLHEFEKDREEYVQSQTRARADDLNAVHQSLAAGNYGPGVESTIHGLYKAGALSEEGYFSATAESIRNQKAQLEKDAALKLVDDAVHGTGPRLDPKDPTTKDAVDDYFKAHVTQSGNVSDAQYAIGAAEIVRQTGIVPKSVQAQIRAGLLSGDPVLATRAAALASKIQGVNPESDVYAGNARVATLAGLVNDNLAAGLPAQKAWDMARQAVDISPEQKKIRDQGYSAAVKANGGNQAALQSTLQSEDGHFWSHAPQAPVGMQTEYESLVHQYYDQAGNIATARQLAGDQLRKVWGVSKVNGTAEYMPFPIRDADVPTVRADIAASAKAAGYQGDPSELHLTPSANTTASGGRVWTVTHVDPRTGDPDVILGKDNRPLPFVLPSPQDFQKNQATLAASKIDAARAQRDHDRANTADQNRFEQQLSDELLRGNPQQQKMAGR